MFFVGDVTGVVSPIITKQLNNTLNVFSLGIEISNKMIVVMICADGKEILLSS